MKIKSEKVLRCKNCKWHESNNPKLPQDGVEEACDTPANQIVAHRGEETPDCFEPKEEV